MSFSCNGEFGVGVHGGADDVDNDVGDGIGDVFGGRVTPHRIRGAVMNVACWRRCAELSGPWLVGGVVGGAAPIFLVVAAAVLLLLCCC